MDMDFQDMYDYLLSPEHTAILRVEFAKEQKDTSTKFPAALKDVDFKKAFLMAHTLKGSAGLINEMELVKLATDAESKLKKGLPPDEVTMELLYKELARVLTDIENEDPPRDDCFCNVPKVIDIDDPDERACILIIDDSKTERCALNMMLASRYDIILAHDGEEGKEIAHQNKIDLILLDLKMPGISGFDVLYDLKKAEETSNIPVIIITGSDSTDDEVRGLSLGAADFMRKPLADAIVRLRVNLHLQLRAHIQKIEKLSLIDGLTGINNRRSFDRIMKYEWNRAQRKNEYLGMLLLDIDRFKQFNDNHGHLNGDNCLKIVAKVMTESIVRGSDYVFRWGGEEFVALMPDTSPKGVLAVAERLRQKISETPVQCDNEAVYITASIGAGAVAPVKNDDITKEQAMADAFDKLDKAMYRAKNNGRNRVEAFE